MKNLFKKLTLLAIILLAVPVISIAANKKNSVDVIKERGKLKIGVFSDYAPFSYIDNHGKYAGFDIEIAKGLGKELLGDENKIEFISLEPANRVEYLASNKVDMVIAVFTVTEDRKKIVDFSNPYMKVAIALAAAKDSNIKTLDDVKGKKVITTKGAASEVFFIKEFPNVELQSYDRISETMSAFKDKRGDVFAQDNSLIFSWVKKNPEFKVVLESVGNEDYISVAVKKGNEDLKNWINKTLEKLGKEKFVHKAYDKTLKNAFGDSINPNNIIIEGGKI